MTTNNEQLNLLAARPHSKRRTKIVVVEDPIQLVREGRITRSDQVPTVYDAARFRVFGEKDPTLEGSAMRDALARARMLVRRDFAGDAQRAAIFVVRAVRFWRARGDRQRWPGGERPTFERICHERIVRAFKLGEIDREIV